MTYEVKKHHLDRRAQKLIDEEKNSNPDDLLNTRQVAEWFGCSEQWLETGRIKGFGPKFIRIGPRQIRYRKKDVLSWLADRCHQSTSEYGSVIGLMISDPNFSLFQKSGFNRKVGQ